LKLFSVYRDVLLTNYPGLRNPLIWIDCVACIRVKAFTYLFGAGWRPRRLQYSWNKNTMALL